MSAKDHPPTFVDAGSTWCKTFVAGAREVGIERTKDALRQAPRQFDFGTGHAARLRSASFENDLLALARGALAVVDEEDFTVLDVGSRDAKYVRFEQRRPVRLDWSVGCSTATGATVEMLGRFYDVDFSSLEPADRATSVTCGVFALERIMDAVARGDPPELGVARFIAGLAREQWRFAGAPERLHLSGGFCDNPAFVAALRRHCEPVPLGRTVPLVGLWALAAERGAVLDPGPPAAILPPSNVDAPGDN